MQRDCPYLGLLPEASQLSFASILLQQHQSHCSPGVVPCQFLDVPMGPQSCSRVALLQAEAIRSSAGIPVILFAF